MRAAFPERAARQVAEVASCALGSVGQISSVCYDLGCAIYELKSLMLATHICIEGADEEIWNRTGRRVQRPWGCRYRRSGGEFNVLEGWVVLAGH
jgi:hypothetical protein